MNNLKKKIAYLQGLAEGLHMGEQSKEGRVLSGIIGVLEDMAEQIHDVERAQTDLEEYVESIDEDLYDLETSEHELDELDGEFVEVQCPKCKELVCFEASIVDDEDLIEVTCPNCDEVVYVNDEDILDDTEDEVFEGTTDTGMQVRLDTEDI